jgi:hypothetical protein
LECHQFLIERGCGKQGSDLALRFDGLNNLPEPQAKQIYNKNVAYLLFNVSFSVYKIRRILRETHDKSK